MSEGEAQRQRFMVHRYLARRICVLGCYASAKTSGSIKHDYTDTVTRRLHRSLIMHRTSQDLRNVALSLRRSSGHVYLHTLHGTKLACRPKQAPLQPKNDPNHIAESVKYSSVSEGCHVPEEDLTRGASRLQPFIARTVYLEVSEESFPFSTMCSII